MLVFDSNIQLSTLTLLLLNLSHILYCYYTPSSKATGPTTILAGTKDNVHPATLKELRNLLIVEAMSCDHLIIKANLS